MFLWSAAANSTVLSSVSQPAVWEDTGVRYLRVGEPISLTYADVRGDDTCASMVASFRRKDVAVRCSPLSDYRPVRWYVFEPEALDYSNVDSCRRRSPGCVVPITYRAREVVVFRGRASLTPVDLKPHLSEGTHWFHATAEQLTVRSMRTAARPPGVQIVVRKNDSYTGYLSELRGVPFVFLPLAMKDGAHQTDARLGADCVALVIYGQRRLGRNVPYVAPPALKRFLAPVPQFMDGSRSARQGDVLHFGFQTAVVYDDRPPHGMLNDDDLIIHTYHGRAEVVRFGALPYRHMEFGVYRWPE